MGEGGWCANYPPHIVEVVFAVDDKLKRYFKKDYFKIRYSREISNLPYGIAVIPFVCNVLPILWLTDATLLLDELDEDFFDCIESLKEGYKAIYPSLAFEGKVVCDKVKYKPIDSEKKSLAFFSGGVDAFATLIAHINENPTLMTICGADIKLDNTSGWKIVMNQIDGVCSDLNLSSIQCYSNFREFIDEEKLCELVTILGAKDDYWHGFQHGIGLISHSAPLAWSYGYTTHYIASSYTIRERDICTCASDPRIDNNMKFCGAKVFHDQFEYCRQEKIKHIVEYCRTNRCKINLRVCWISDRGDNCGLCEKCIRTIYALLAEKEDPRNYGFHNVDLLKIKLLLKYKTKFPDILLPLWDDIINRVKESPKGSTQIEWLRRYNAKKLNNVKIKKMIPIFRRIMKYYC